MSGFIVDATKQRAQRLLSMMHAWPYWIVTVS